MILSGRLDPINYLVIKIPYVVRGTPFAQMNSNSNPILKFLYFIVPVG